MKTKKTISQTTAWSSAFFRALLLMVFSSLLAVESQAQSQWTNWSEWRQSECYEGIWFRHRSQPTYTQDKQKVQVEVRNRYRHTISVSTRITNNPSDRTLYRIDISAGETYSDGATESFLNAGQRFYFLHDQVRFEGDSYGDGYRECDRNRY